MAGMTSAALVRAAVGYSGIEKQEWPDLVGVSDSTFRRWMSDDAKYEPSAEQIARILAVSGMPAWMVVPAADEIGQRLDRLYEMLDTMLERRTEQGETIIDRLDRLEKALNARTDALLPGVRELLQAAQATPAAEPQRTSRTGK